MSLNIWNFNLRDQAPRFFLRNFFFALIQIFILEKIFNADDNEIRERTFWIWHSWVVLLLWIIMVFSYLSEVRDFSWIVGLILSTMDSILVFIVVFLAGITAFGDAFSAIHTGMFIDMVNN